MVALALMCVLTTAAQADAPPTLVVVVGAPGTPEYGKQFEQWADRMIRAADDSGARVVRLGPGDEVASEGDNDRQRLQSLLAAEAKASAQPLWLVLVGHGAYDRRKATFNLNGPDISADDLAEWLAPFERPLAIVNCAACSGPFLNRLAAPGRVVVTATRSGAEQNFTRFGEYFSQAIGDLAADLDKDRQVSLLEAFLAASRRVQEFYQQESRLATEHALLDDTGDGLGVAADWFQGVRATRAAKDGAPVDGLRASQLYLLASAEEKTLTPEQRSRRDALEAEIEALRQQKIAMDESAYYARLELLLVQLAQLYAEAEATDNGSNGP